MWDFFKGNIVWKSLSILPASDKRKIPIVMIAQVFLALIDLLGVAIIGVVGALAVSGVSTGSPGLRVSRVLSFFGLESLSLQQQATVLGLTAASLLIFKTLTSAWLVRRTTFFLARRGAVISGELAKRLFNSSSEFIKRRSPQENLFALTTGVVTISIGILSISIAVFADVVLLLILFSGLLAVDFFTALLTLALFSTSGLILYKIMHIKAKELGVKNAEINIASNQTILEGLSSFREITVRNRKTYYASKIASQRLRLADVSAGLANMTNVSKYAIEATLVIGALLISAFQFATQDAVHAVGILSVFMAASSRIAPAILRLQQGAIQIRANAGSAFPSLELIKELSEVLPVHEIESVPNFEHVGFIPEINMSEIAFTFEDNSTPTLNGISMHVKPGEMVAVVGPSGAGKSTLVDALLGILKVTQGSIQISHTSPEVAISTWPGAIAYLPQDVVLSPGTLRTNIAFGFDDDEIDPVRVTKAIELAQLKDFISSLPDGLETKVSDRGDNFSGGQKQRIGIARALYTNPKVIILDEATSALDGETEAAISESLQQIRGSTSIIMIAHRLSSVMKADRIHYLEAGVIKASGTFDEVKKINPDFARQAKLMGL